MSGMEGRVAEGISGSDRTNPPKLPLHGGGQYHRADPGHPSRWARGLRCGRICGSVGGRAAGDLWGTSAGGSSLGEHRGPQNVWGGSCSTPIHHKKRFSMLFPQKSQKHRKGMETMLLSQLLKRCLHSLQVQTYICTTLIPFRLFPAPYAEDKVVESGVHKGCTALE